MDSLDSRAKWDKLPAYMPYQKSKKIDVSTDDLKELCRHHQCSVLIFRFNVLSRISNAYLNDCKTRKEKADKNVELKLFKTKGIRTYKKFYEPRLLWFAQQREYLKHLRTDKLYIQCVLTSIKSKRQRKADKPANIFMEEDLLPIVSTQEFMENISLLPVSPQSTQHIDEHIPTISSLSQLILMLK